VSWPASSPRVKFLTSGERIPIRIRINHRNECGRDTVGQHRIVVEDDDTGMSLTWQISEILDVTGNYGQRVFTSVGEDVIFVVCTLSKHVSNVLGEQTSFFR